MRTRGPLLTRPARRLAAFVAAAVAAGLLIDRIPAPMLINESPSLPRGLYVRDLVGTPRRGAIVAFEQPPVARDYLSRGGMPAEVLLIKRVAATAGDEVCLEDGVLRTPQRVIAVPRRDRAGRPLPVWSGCGRLGRGEVFVLGDTETSFDSRYFGPVRRERLTGVFREGVRW